MPNHSLRPATEDDKDFLFEVFKRSMRGYIAWAWGWDEEFQRQGLWKNLPVEHFKVVCVADEAIGALYVEESDEHHSIRTIFLEPGFQGRGVGTALLKDEGSRARKAGKPLVLKVIKINPAKRLYERLGFQVVKEDGATCTMQLT